jgi:hypothetical protein
VAVEEVLHLRNFRVAYSTVEAHDRPLPRLGRFG